MTDDDDRVGTSTPRTRTCRAVHRRHGTTYFWATHVLPARQRRHVHALYGFCRHADDIVDEPRRRVAGDAASRADRVRRPLRAGPAGADADDAPPDPMARRTRCSPPFAVTVAQLGIPDEASSASSARWRWTSTSPPTRRGTTSALHGRLGGGDRRDDAARSSNRSTTRRRSSRPRHLGLAFQLTNFLRDVGEDLDRGRVYLPEEDLDRFGADPWTRTVTPEWRELMRFEIARARALYASADQGLPWLPPRSAACVRTARILYSRILVRDRGQRLRRVLDPSPGVDRAQTGHRRLVPRRHDRHERP